MTQFRSLFVGGALLLGAVAANATWFTSEAAFLAATTGVNYTEDFSGFTYGGAPSNLPSWAAPGGNGYGWTATAAGNLWANDSALSTNLADTALVLTFTGNPVTAFGGFVGNGDLAGEFIPGTVTMTLSNGETQDIIVGADDAFLGWVGVAGSPITSVTLTTASAAEADWISLDHAITSAAPVPEPATLAALGIGAAALLRRRKK